MLKPLFIVLVLLFSLRLLGQHPYYYKIDDETGLPSNEVYELLQDDFGYVWIGCDAGLFRYDGFRFKGYTNAKQNGKSISYLRKDKKGRIWCKNFNGQIYRVEGDSLRIIIDNSGLESTISQFAIDENLELWVANCNIIECYDENGKNKKIIYEEKKTKNQSHFQEIICFNNYVYFTKSGIGLFRYNKQNGKVNFLSAGFVKSSIYTRFNFSVSSGRLFMIAEKFDQHVFTVFEVKDSLHKLDEYELKGENKRAYYLCFDRDEQPWLCTTNGAYKPDFGSAKLVDNNFLFQGEKISFMMQDKEGNYWFTSLHNGIFVVPDMNLIRKTTGNSTLTTNNVSAIKKLQNGSVLLGTYSGKLLLDKNGAIHPFADKFDDRYSTVKKIQETDEYILASRIFLSVIHKSTGREVLSCRLNARDFLIKEDTLFSVSSAAFSKIPVSGLVSADCDKVSIPRRVGGKALCSLPGDRHVYIGFTDGFYSYCDGKFEEITLNNDPIYVQHVAVHENEAWLVTSNRGVMKLTNGKIFPSGLDKLGIKEREVKALYSKEHYLFVVNNNLLYILNLKTQNVFAYSSITGINPKDITDLDYHNGIVYLATNKGMSTFPLNMKWYNDVQPPIKLDRVMLSDSLIPMDSIIHLTYRNNNLHIEFISVAFRSRGAFFYEYRLKELDTAWTLTKGSENYAVFSSLPPGKFTFEVRAVN
ncbi:MAG TPA: two-component regulator propeller domain-containing protein, partial [Bacteroidia bacterium]